MLVESHAIYEMARVGYLFIVKYDIWSYWHLSYRTSMDAYKWAY